MAVLEAFHWTSSSSINLLLMNNFKTLLHWWVGPNNCSTDTTNYHLSISSRDNFSQSNLNFIEENPYLLVLVLLLYYYTILYSIRVLHLWVGEQRHQFFISITFSSRFQHGTAGNDRDQHSNWWFFDTLNIQILW